MYSAIGRFGRSWAREGVVDEEKCGVAAVAEAFLLECVSSRWRWNRGWGEGKGLDFEPHDQARGSGD